MRLELAERLRCPSPHVPTPMIVVAREAHDRVLIEGVAGCPVCHREARVRAGHVEFGAADAASPGVAARAVAGGHADVPDVERVAALLGLAEPGGAVLLTGRYAGIAEALAALVDVAVVVLADREPPAAGAHVAAVLGALDRVPFTDGTFRGAALDAGVSSALAADAVRAVAPGGRLLGPASRPRPAGTTELARDDREWVAAREGIVPIVELRRR